MNDPLALVEAAYQHEESEAAWLGGIVRAASGYDCGFGVAAYSVALEGAKPAIGSFVRSGDDDGIEQSVRLMTASLPRAVAARVYAPTEYVGNAAFRLRRVGAAKVHAWALVAGDPAVRAVTLVFPGDAASFDPNAPFPHRRAALGLVGAHIGAALRLRRLSAPLSETDRATEAVLDARGRVLHAEGEARDRRESLTEAVIRRERARGKLRRLSPDEAAGMWSVLVDGRWSIVDSIERDGKRLVLARKNPISRAEVFALTEAERDVVWLTSLAHSYKYIAYELGITPSTVHRRLASALRKLRLRTRADLLRALGRAPS